MKLAQLFSTYSSLRWGESAQSEVSGLCVDSRQLTKGCVFVALKGRTVDAHDFLPQVCQDGAIAVVVEDLSQIPDDYLGAVVKTDNSRCALNRLAARFYGDPADHMFNVGVTGTNGKTTTTYMIETILAQFGWKTGVIGTIDHHLGETKWATHLTTPDTLVFHKRLSEFSAMGAEAVALEVSSIALHQQRVDAIPFDVVVFTNLTQDHLDYHRDMEQYFAMKRRLFDEVLASSGKTERFALINIDDEWGRQIDVCDGARCWSYGQGEADLRLKVNQQNFSGSWIELETPRGFGEFHLPVPGLFNAYNAVAAIGCGLAAGVSLETCLTAMESFAGVPGRFQRVENARGLNVFVDYAHTADALENMLKTARQIRAASQSSHRILVVFGCGGDRDFDKRPQMGRVAFSGADCVFVTTDNPRHEGPRAIIDDILKGVPREAIDDRVFVEVLREKAIHRALQYASREDVILIAGKGHEDYQVIGDEKIPFSDVTVVEDFFKVQNK